MNNKPQIAITHIKDKLLLVFLDNDKIYDVVVDEDEYSQKPSVGNIYRGKVQNIVSNISAAFVEFSKGQIGYLPLHECDKKLKCGDEIIVQIKKAPVKTKQAVLTVYPEIAGESCVITTKNTEKSISQKIQSEEKIQQLKNLLKEYVEEPYGIVLRTKAKNLSNDEIQHECHSLLAKVHECMEQGCYKTCFSTLWRGLPRYREYIQNFQIDKLERIITDDSVIFEKLQNEYGEKVVYYKDESYSLDNLLGISSKLKKAYEKRVWLKSGGNLVIEPTEALTVIDVNTGKAVGGNRNKETTFFKINCEAAVEAARQIRMRNLSGIILIDFIDMKKKENQEELLHVLRTELGKDVIKTTVVDITKLGLVEITRMKKYPPIWETLSEL